MSGLVDGYNRERIVSTVMCEWSVIVENGYRSSNPICKTAVLTSHAFKYI